MWKQYNVDRATVSNYRETDHFSKRGNPIGIRIGYEVSFPYAAGYFVDVRLDVVNPVLQHYNLEMSAASPKQRIEPWPEYDWLSARRFEGGTVYRFTEKLTPVFLFEALYDQESLKQGDLCIVEAHSDSLTIPQLRQRIRSDATTRYIASVRVGSNNDFVTPRVAMQRETAEYPVRRFYLSARKEQAPVCTPDPATGWPKVK